MISFKVKDFAYSKMEQLTLDSLEIIKFKERVFIVMINLFMREILRMENFKEKANLP
jgi:hypothetical protein